MLSFTASLLCFTAVASLQTGFNGPKVEQEVPDFGPDFVPITEGKLIPFQTMLPYH